MKTEVEKGQRDPSGTQGEHLQAAGGRLENPTICRHGSGPPRLSRHREQPQVEDPLPEGAYESTVKISLPRSLNEMHSRATAARVQGAVFLFLGHSRTASVRRPHAFVPTAVFPGAASMSRFWRLEGSEHFENGFASFDATKETHAAVAGHPAFLSSPLS